MNFSRKFKVDPGPKFKLKKWDPSYSGGFDKDRAEEKISSNADKLFEKQAMLQAEGERAVLVVLQGMDTAGKDGVIHHVMRGLNPQACTVHSFKIPSEEERSHDYLWRVHLHTPEKGTIGIFNRSQYEDVLVTRVKKLVPKKVWKRRYDEINEFERMLTANGLTILKFFLHVSKKEQAERLKKRIQDPLKNWKFNPNDLSDRGNWDEYQEAYEDAINLCSTKWAPWYVIPSDKKWFRNLAVSEILNHALTKMNLKWPKPRVDLKKLKIA